MPQRKFTTTMTRTGASERYLFKAQLERMSHARNKVWDTKDTESDRFQLADGEHGKCVNVKVKVQGVESWRSDAYLGYQVQSPRSERIRIPLIAVSPLARVLILENAFGSRQNVFEYFKACDLASLQYEDMGKGRYGYLNVALGRLSYSQVPIQFRGAIFGVTGSLGVLPPKQLDNSGLA